MVTMEKTQGFRRFVYEEENWKKDYQKYFNLNSVPCDHVPILYDAEHIAEELFRN